MPRLLVNESEVDVLVIGAGPSGLFCANALAKAGIHVRIVDIRPERVTVGQADGIQPHTMEVLQSYGLAERLLREGTQIHTVALWNPGPNGGIEPSSKTANINAPTARYPFETTMHQGNIESIFIESMASMGVSVERPITPNSIDLSADEAELRDVTSHPVQIVLKSLADADYREVVRAKFVVGSDGAHSWVRKALGIETEGEHTDSTWGVLDILPETDFPDIRSKCLIHSLNGTCGTVPREDDMVRMYIQMAEGDINMNTDGKLDKTQISPEQLFEVAQRSFKPYNITMDRCFWSTIYKVGQRVASKYSAHERVFITGDACHTHSPKAGQGMNVSMCDSHNLAWKLTQVLRRQSDISLLRTYEAERRKYAQDLIDFDRMFSKLVETKSSQTEIDASFAHTQMMSVLQAFSEFTSGLAVHYAPSAIVDISNQSLASKLIIGKRVPPQAFIRASDGRPFEVQDLLPADTRFKVLIFAGDTNQTGQMQRVKACAEQLRRPDAFFKRLGGDDATKVFSLLIIASVSIFAVDFTALIRAFQTHWSQVFVDDAPVYNHRDAVGEGYDAYGIDRTEGAVVVVRPDGYVAKVSSIEGISELNTYFTSFMKV